NLLHPRKGAEMISSWTLLAMAGVVTMAGAGEGLQGQHTGPYPTIGEIICDDLEMDRLISKNAKIEILASGFAWTEGPVYVKAGGYVLFSDIPRNSLMKWKEGEGATLYLKPSGFTGIEPYSKEPGCNGNTLDRQGRLVSCEHGDRRI